MRISDWSSDVCSSDLANERLRPIAQSAPRIRIALHGQSTEVGPFVVGVAEGVGNCGCRYIEHGPCDRFKLYARGACDNELFGQPREDGCRDRIPEDVMRPGHLSLRTDVEIECLETDLAAFARPKHTPGGPGVNQNLIAVARAMPDEQFLHELSNVRETARSDE